MDHTGSVTEKAQREEMRAEVRRRMAGPDAEERVLALVLEWREAALRQMALRVSKR